jgi:hypothetical protein
VRAMRVLLASLLAGLVVTASASAGVGLGVLGDPSRFDSLTGQATASRHVIVGWGQGAGRGGSFAEILATMGEVPLLGINPGGAISPGEIARGRGDAYLVALNEALAAYGRRVWVRPMGEMNGHWNAYSAYDANGRARDADHSTRAFRAAFARIAVIVRGGPKVAPRLRKLGQPPVAEKLAPTQAKLVWNPQGYGSPDVPGNSAEAYYPGAAYVDLVGDDLCDIRGKAEWAAADVLYRAHPNKPFGFPEWGLWGLDDPAFVEAMAAWVKAHPRTRLLAWYNGKPGGIFDLASKPRSLATYRRLIAPLGR